MIAAAFRNHTIYKDTQSDSIHNWVSFQLLIIICRDYENIISLFFSGNPICLEGFHPLVRKPFQDFPIKVGL